MIEISLEELVKIRIPFKFKFGEGMTGYVYEVVSGKEYRREDRSIPRKFSILPDFTIHVLQSDYIRCKSKVGSLL